jgi:formylglycine-generating enzyme required for sulfatase activity
LADIFISYRRDDAAAWAGRLTADLRRKFPRGDVFQDISAIGIGEDFVDAMRRSLATCAVTIVMIGPRWLGARDEHGQRRLDDPDDWVRLEIEESLKRDGLRVVPLLVGTARMPRAAELPESLRPLARRNAHEISDRRWDYDVSELVKALKKIGALAAGPKASGSAGTVAPPAEWVPGKVFRDGDDCPEMVVIPAGEFLMGSPVSEVGRSDDEGPQHIVRIGKPFALGRYALTIGEFSRFVQASGYRTEAERDSEQGIRVWDGRKWDWSKGKSWRNPGFAQDDRHPVVGVSWNDAQAYIKWLGEKTGKGYRLPSEAEWEYAARAGARTRYPWGDYPGSDLANFSNSGSRWSGKQTAPVGSFAANAFGLCDMIGNVWEWLHDCWNESYLGAPDDGRAWESGDCGRRVVRGGSWDDGPGSARAACRDWLEPGIRISNTGFRLARTL